MARAVVGVLVLLTWSAAVALAQAGVTLGPKDGAGLPPTDLARVAVGSLVPDFTLESKDGAAVTLSSFRARNNVMEGRGRRDRGRSDQGRPPA